MLPHLSRFSLWLAALTAAASLLLPGRQGGTLASIAMLALLAALWLRRFNRPPPEAALPDSTGIPAYDDVAMMEFAALAARQLEPADSLKTALQALGDLMVHELGAEDLRIHHPAPSAPKSAAIADALRTGQAVLNDDNGFVLPVFRDRQPVAVLEVRRIALSVMPAAFGRLLDVLRAQLEGVAVRETRAVDDEDDAPAHIEGSVLWIEPDPAEQEAIGRRLRRLGLTLRIASTPLQAERALAEAHFDLVLIAVGAAFEPDGFAMLVQRRRGSGAGLAPVALWIALVDEAAGDNRERLITLGFDDCLFKPLRQGPLLAMLTQRFSPACPAVPHMADTGRLTGGAVPVIDEVLDTAALARLRELDPKNETQLLARVAKAFETSAARYLPQLAAARQSGETRDLSLVAHTLKSSSSSIGALKLSRQCAEIEAMIKAGQSEGLGPRVDAVCTEIGIVLQALTRLLDTTA
jgi:HPt (histidine-containing phosphotransfer) domain-containing protein/BarA-like signal transduction histidine kinase